MKEALFYGGVAITLTGIGAPALLPRLPSSIQSNPTLQPIGTFLINNSILIALIGLALLIAGVLL